MCADRHNTGDVRKASRLEGRIEVTSNRQSGVDVILIAIENRALQISFEIKKDQSAQTIFNKIRGIMPYRLLGDKVSFSVILSGYRCTHVGHFRSDFMHNYF